MCDDVQLCNHYVREFLILTRTWFAFGLPSKSGCDTYKGRFRRIFFGHESLIISGITIKKANNPISRRIINQRVGYRHRIFIFRSCFHYTKIVNFLEPKP
jgi:hypothetical protein